MTTYLVKSCSFCLPRVPFVNCRQFMYLVISLFGFEGRIWDLIVSVPDHCLSFYFSKALLLCQAKQTETLFYSAIRAIWFDSGLLFSQENESLRQKVEYLSQKLCMQLS